MLSRMFMRCAFWAYRAARCVRGASWRQTLAMLAYALCGNRFVVPAVIVS
jgi:hypothetical protein